MNRDQIRKITDTHYHRLKKRGAKIIESFDPEAIHQFRVEYKKLRAFLRMLSRNERTDEEIKMAKKLKKAYAVSGSIRDLQLQLERVRAASRKELKKPSSYLNLLQKEIEKLKPELADMMAEHPVTESKKKTDPALPHLFPLKGFKKFVLRKWGAIHAILAGGHFSDELLHTIRKILKDLFYNLEKYSGHEHALLALAVMKKKEAGYFDKLLDELGDFQDRCNAIALVKSCWLARLNTYNQEFMERVKKSWIKEKTRMKRDLLKKLKTDLVSV